MLPKLFVCLPRLAFTKALMTEQREGDGCQLSWVLAVSTTAHLWAVQEPELSSGWMLKFTFRLTCKANRLLGYRNYEQGEKQEYYHYPWNFEKITTSIDSYLEQETSPDVVKNNIKILALIPENESVSVRQVMFHNSRCSRK